MKQAITTRLSHANRRQEDISILHFKRFLEAASALSAAHSAHVIQQRNAKFRVLHVKRALTVVAEKIS